jgi:acyl-CoA thioester hydrolase
MTRLDRRRLENGVFPYHCQVPTRFADLDRLGHINNVATAEILEEARSRLFHTFDLIGGIHCQLVVAGSIIEFGDEMLWPDPVHISVGLLDVGRTSFRLGQLAVQNSRIGAYAEIVLVMRNDEGPLPLPDEWRNKLETLRIVHPGRSA